MFEKKQQTFNFFCCFKTMEHFAKLYRGLKICGGHDAAINLWLKDRRTGSPLA